MNLFKLDGPVMRVLNYVFELLMLNIFFIITCIPIVTIGAAVTALYAVTLDRLDETYILTRFYSAFRKNFRQATVAWVAIVLILAFIAMDFYLLTVVNIPGGMVLLVLLCIALVLIAATCAYLFPLIGHFKNKLKNTVRNAFVLALSMLPKTVIMLVVAWFPLVMYAIDIDLFMRCMLPWLLVGFTLSAQINCKILRGIFLKVAPEEESKNTYLVEE